MKIAVAVLITFLVLCIDMIVIYMDGDIRNLYEDWEEPEKPKYPDCIQHCELSGSDYCIYKCWAEQIMRQKDEEEQTTQTK